MTPSRVAGRVLVVLAGIVASPAAAQVTVTHLLEAQAGAVPFAASLGLPRNPVGVYGQLDAVAEWAGSRAGVRFEAFDHTPQTDDYRSFTQRWAEWQSDRVRVRVGDFYAILGRGLTLRAFELPGVVLDDPGSDLRRAFSHELDGVHVEAGGGPVRLVALSGSPGTGSVHGGEIALGPLWASRIGATYLRSASADGSRQTEIGSGFVELDPLGAAGVAGVALPLYAEYAQGGQTFQEWWEIARGDRPAHALYASAAALWGRFTLTAEWKDYRRFRLGLNDPPSLVREHAFALPNRATHVMNAESESGTQFEGSWSVPRWGAVTLNHSRAAGTPGIEHLRFEENYAEIHVAASRWPWLEATLFGDRAFDRFERIESRTIWGAASTVRSGPVWSLALELQRLDAERAGPIGPREGWTDWYASAELARASWGTAGVVWQRTTDPAEEDPALFDERVDPRSYLGVVVAAAIGTSHRVQLFAGERRGGPACTAGTCYEVEAFKGAELRVLSRWP